MMMMMMMMMMIGIVKSTYPLPIGSFSGIIKQIYSIGTYCLVTRLKWPHVRESGFRIPGSDCLWNPESGKNLLLEHKKQSGNLGFGMRNTAQGDPESH